MSFRDLSQISHTSQRNIIFAKFLEIQLDNNITSWLTHIRWRKKIHLKVIWVYLFWLFIKNTALPNCSLFKNSRRLGFRNYRNQQKPSSFIKEVSAVVIFCVFIFIWLKTPNVCLSSIMELSDSLAKNLMWFPPLLLTFLTLWSLFLTLYSLLSLSFSLR